MFDFYTKMMLEDLINKRKNKMGFILVLNVAFIGLSVLFFILINRDNVNYLKYLFYAYLVLVSLFKYGLWFNKCQNKIFKRS